MKLNIRRVVLLCVFSRLICILLSFVINDAFSDARNTGILSLHLENESIKYQNTAIWKLLKSFINWDGEYYLRVSYFGDYEYEHQHAFFPLYPLMVNLISKAFYRLNYSKIIVNMIVGVSISNLAFVLAGVGLYLFQFELSKRVKTRNTVHPGISTLFFVFPSSNIFNSAMYSESLFACFNFWSAFLILKSEHYSKKNGFYSLNSMICLSVSVFLMALASGVRSNGVLNSIPLFFYFLSTSPLPKKAKTGDILGFIIHWFTALVLFLVSISSLVAYLAYTYLRYCVNIKDPRPWCTETIPNIYSFVQSEYWDNGPFNYWKAQKADKFLIVMPYILVVLASINMFFKRSQRDNTVKNTCGNFRNALVFFGYVFQVYFLLLSIFIFGYIEVLIRLFNCIPAFFTFMGYFYCNYPKYSKYILLFQIFSFTFGNIWFPNFLPWT